METPEKIAMTEPPKLVAAAQRLDAADCALKDAAVLIKKFPAGREALNRLADAIVLERGVSDALNRYLSGQPFQLDCRYEVRVVRESASNA